MPSLREKVKIFIQLSRTPEEADKIITENFHFESCKEKIAFLKGMFDCKVLDAKPYDSDEIIYNLMLISIIKASQL